MREEYKYILNDDEVLFALKKYICDKKGNFFDLDKTKVAANIGTENGYYAEVILEKI